MVGSENYFIYWEYSDANCGVPPLKAADLVLGWPAAEPAHQIKVTASVSMSHTLPASLDAAAPRFRLMERMTSRKVMSRKRFTITPKMANVRGSVVPSVDDVPPHCCRFRFTAVCRPPRRPDTLCSVYHLSLRWKESLPVDRCCERSFVCEYNEQSKHEGCRLVLHRRRRWFGFG